LACATAFAQLPLTGVPVPELSWVGTNLRDFMDENDISGGLVAISRGGVIIYQRGCGYHDEDEAVSMPENALVRVASCTKPFTAAAIQQFIADGDIDLTTNAFNLGQPGGGELNITPWPSLGDSRLRDVTIRHLLTHEGGWDRSPPNSDWTYEECEIADDMGVSSPPGRTNTMRWILGQSLQFTPGDRADYSNIGYLAAGLIVEQRSGMSLINYLRANVLTPDMWVPSTDLRQGRTFRPDQPLREAWYDSGLATCVFDDECVGCGLVNLDVAYGGWDHEARVGQGGLVVSAATMLRMADRYYVESGHPNIGWEMQPDWSGSHGGSLGGVNCRITQRADGTRIFVWFNKKNADEDEGNFASLYLERIADELDGQSDWPTAAVDGFWIQPGPPVLSYLGSYNHPMRGFIQGLAQVTDGTRISLKPGTDTFVGTINKKIMLRAPEGAARLGG